MILLSEEEIREITSPMLMVSPATIAKAQLKKAMEVMQSKFRREVIPSGSTRYSADVVEFLNSMNSTYLMITNEDWQALKKECDG